jgi:hypothetical protein
MPASELRIFELTRRFARFQPPLLLEQRHHMHDLAYRSITHAEHIFYFPFILLLSVQLNIRSY